MGKNQDLAKGIFVNGITGNAATATTAGNVSGGTLSGNLIANNYGIGLVGLYNASRYQNVFSMGDSYKLTADGTGVGTMYGIAWTHSNIGGQSKAGLSHQALFMDNGVTKTAIGNGIWTAGSVTGTIFYDLDNTSYFADFSNTGTSINTAGDIVSNSDIRLKENITIIDDAINKIKKINGVTYNKIGETKRTAGVIAQDVEAVLPEVVSQQGDFKSVAYGNMVGLLIEAIKDQQKVIENLENRINLLEEK